MEAKKLEIKTLSIQIKVLTVDQKRFSKSVFDQLPAMNPCHKGVLIYPLIGHVIVRDISRAPGIMEKVGLFACEGLLFKWYPFSTQEKKMVADSDQLFISI